MQIGCSAPTSGPLTHTDNLTRIATEAEMLGFDYVTVSDHIMIPTDVASRYPYTESGEFPSGARVDRHEQLTAATWVAAKTSKLRIVTSVMVVPHRPAVLTAKILATIDVLSKGRLTLGIGAGWMREEFEAIGTPPFEARGAVTDEYMMACKELWEKEDPGSRANTPGSATWCFSRNRCSGRSRSGWAAKAVRRCGGRLNMAMRGIRSAPIRSFRWTR